MPKNPNASSKNAIFEPNPGHPNFPKSPKTQEINPPRPLDTHRGGGPKARQHKENPGPAPLPGKIRLKGNDWVLKRAEIRPKGEGWVVKRAEIRLKGQDWVVKRAKIRQGEEWVEET